MMKQVIISVSICACCFMLFGCVSLSTNKTQVINLPYDISMSDTIRKLGEPLEQKKISSDITRLAYKNSMWSSFEQYWLYFRNDKLIKKSYRENIYKDIQDYYELGLISKDEMERQCSIRQANAMQILQAYSEIKTMEYERESLDNQKQIISNQKKILKQQTGTTFTPGQNLYDQYGNSLGRIDSNGHVYDQYGNPQGSIDSSGNIYDQYGNSLGRIGR